ncbi:hypothetical protein GCM10007932_12040 [Vibrio penaeicida]|uniref:Uncharacterized protein n=1 Tax=Vibrio penaeicida TaxID=104609 RepID=A0AAV5NMG9_9VIBR|nr:hypothetical protein GCM10007932_12040 [Vibrio penaeicida]
MMNGHRNKDISRNTLWVYKAVTKQYNAVGPYEPELENHVIGMIKTIKQVANKIATTR